MGKPINPQTGEEMLYTDVHAALQSGALLLDASGEIVTEAQIAELYAVDIERAQAAAAAPAPAETAVPAPEPVAEPAVAPEPAPVETATPAPVAEPAPAPVETVLPAPAAPVETVAPAPVAEPAPAPQPAPVETALPAPAAPVETAAPAPVAEPAADDGTVAGYTPEPFIQRGDVQVADIPEPQALTLLTPAEAKGLRMFARQGDYLNYCLALVQFLETKPAA